MRNVNNKTSDSTVNRPSWVGKPMVKTQSTMAVSQAPAPKKIKMRPYRSEDDYWGIREFLRQVFLLNDCKELSWHVARLDYWRWHGIMNLKEFPAIDEVIFIWETPDGQMAAVLNPEGKG